MTVVRLSAGTGVSRGESRISRARVSDPTVVSRGDLRIDRARVSAGITNVRSAGVTADGDPLDTPDAVIVTVVGALAPPVAATLPAATMPALTGS